MLKLHYPLASIILITARNQTEKRLFAGNNKDNCEQVWFQLGGQQREKEQLGRTTWTQARMAVRNRLNWRKYIGTLSVNGHEEGSLSGSAL